MGQGDRLVGERPVGDGQSRPGAPTTPRAELSRLSRRPASIQGLDDHRGLCAGGLCVAREEHCLNHSGQPRPRQLRSAGRRPDRPPRQWARCPLLSVKGPDMLANPAIVQLNALEQNGMTKEVEGP